MRRAVRREGHGARGGRAPWMLVTFALLSALCLGGCAAETPQEAAESPDSTSAQTANESAAGDNAAESEERDSEGTAADAPEPASPDASSTAEGGTDMSQTTMTLSVNGTELEATLADNSSARALADLLAQGPLTIEMSDYASMEKVGPIGQSLPRNDTPTDTEAGDIILYQGNQLVVYYSTNSWNFTRIGNIQGVTADELREILGTGSVTITFSLA